MLTIEMKSPVSTSLGRDKQTIKKKVLCCTFSFFTFIQSGSNTLLWLSMFINIILPLKHSLTQPEAELHLPDPPCFIRSFIAFRYSFLWKPYFLLVISFWYSPHINYIYTQLPWEALLSSSKRRYFQPDRQNII